MRLVAQALLAATLVGSCSGCLTRYVLEQASKEDVPRSESDFFAAGCVQGIPEVRIAASDYNCRAYVVGAGSPEVADALFARVPADGLHHIVGSHERVVRAYAPT